jgi:hypothetical protein
MFQAAEEILGGVKAKEHSHVDTCNLSFNSPLPHG